MINEASPNTFEGSISRDMLKSRIWISDKLKETKIPIKNCVVLGSWYGILPYVLKKYNHIENIYANDINEEYIKISEKLNPNIRHIKGDCNRLKYNNIDCVINPSANDIVNNGWFERIPKHTTCLLHIGNGITKGCPRDLNELKRMYPLDEVYFEGKLNSIDNEGKFVRHMIIGKK